MMARSLDRTRHWMRYGTTLFATSVDRLSDVDFTAPSLLPGWTRAHVVAHVAANADAVGNLVYWAGTGERTPMYASAQARAEGIERGTQLPAEELRSWLHDSATQLESSMSALTDEQWQQQVVTAQGRTVPTTEVPWMRAREVCVHAVDLGTDAGFDDLCVSFLESLIDEITVKRGLATVPDGALPEIAAWLSGRPHSLSDAPALEPWL